MTVLFWVAPPAIALLTLVGTVGGSAAEAQSTPKPRAPSSTRNNALRFVKNKALPEIA
jgi:hypothetical protein